MAYTASWSSLRTHPAPQWLRDGKFGIYTHWGVYSVPACGPNVSWYPFNMYQPGTPQYQFHVEHYGGPEKFGYKDFIPMFTGEKFDADQWAEIFSDAGAVFAGPVAEHHDGFSLWDTRYSPWNAVNMGPRRDIVGLLEKAVRARGMKFMTALHHAENWRFYPHWVKQYDTADPRWAGLYGEPHNLAWADLSAGQRQGMDLWALQDQPSQAFLDTWQAKVREVVDRYRPDLMWFDFGLEFVQEHYKREMVAYYYNAAQGWGKDVTLTYKWHHMVPGAGLEDVELGGAEGLRYNEWLTDSTVDDGSAWGYQWDAKYKSADEIIHYLIDNVSKNGYLLLNVGPRPDGTIPEPAQETLRGIGRWMRVNGEAIYGTTPWMVYGEGPAKVADGPFQEAQKPVYTSQDIRFTCRDDALYAILLGWPRGEAVIGSAKALYPAEIDAVSLLGHDGDLPWRYTDRGLQVALPEDKPCDSAWVLKIKRKRPF